MAEAGQDIDGFYGERIDKLAESMFPDGFLNFGYWSGIPSHQLDIQKRIHSGKKLYHQVLDDLLISPGDKLLEIGCGRGRGTALAATEYDPREVHGIDAVDRQVEKARKENEDAIRVSSGRLNYTSANANSLPHSKNYFDKAYSVEVAVHFTDLRKIVRELDRVLKEKAVVSIASIFSPTHTVKLADWWGILTKDEAPPSTIQAHSVPDIIEPLLQTRFDEIKVRSIGKHVWPGFNRYLDHLGVPKHSKRRNWLTAFESNILDYYVITAKRGSEK